MAEGRALPLIQSRHALACLKVASTTILRLQLAPDTLESLLLCWDATYSLFTAIMCLVFLVSAHNGTCHPTEAWRRGAIGIGMLSAHTCMDNCASTCLKLLRAVIRQLHHTVHFDFDKIEATTQRTCELRPRAPEIASLESIEDEHSLDSATPDGTRSLTTLGGPKTPHNTPRCSTPDADKVLARAEGFPLGWELDDLLDLSMEDLSPSAAASA